MPATARRAAAGLTILGVSALCTFAASSAEAVRAAGESTSPRAVALNAGTAPVPAHLGFAIRTPSGTASRGRFRANLAADAFSVDVDNPPTDGDSHGGGGMQTLRPPAPTPTAPVAKPVAAKAATPPAAPAWVRPNAGALSSPFGRRWGRMHEGIDLAGGYGSPIRAATAGTVLYAGPESGYGRVLKLADADGTQTWYGHMERFVVKAGDHVVAGQEIALVGAAGDATGPHLHFEVRIGGVPIDPIPFLAAHGVRI